MQLICLSSIKVLTAAEGPAYSNLKTRPKPVTASTGKLSVFFECWEKDQGLDTWICQLYRVCMCADFEILLWQCKLVILKKTAIQKYE